MSDCTYNRYKLVVILVSIGGGDDFGVPIALGMAPQTLYSGGILD